MTSAIDPQPAAATRQSPTRGVPPTPELLSDGIAQLLDEVDSVLSSTLWEFERGGDNHKTWLLYDAAALRHCCRLLFEIRHAAEAELELAVRTLWRSHTESWLVAMYIHFGGFPALERVVQDSRHNFEALNSDIHDFTEKLAADKKTAREAARKVDKVNTGISRWNAANPDARQKPLHAAPRAPQLAPNDVALSNIIDLYGTYEPQPLAVSEIVDALTKWAPEKGFSLESLRPIYHLYRMQSATGAHPTLTVLDSYFEPGEKWRTLPSLATGTISGPALAGALHSTAFLASRILGERDSPTPVADGLRLWLDPEPTGHAAWSTCT